MIRLRQLRQFGTEPHERISCLVGKGRFIGCLSPSGADLIATTPSGRIDPATGHFSWSLHVNLSSAAPKWANWVGEEERCCITSEKGRGMRLLSVRSMCVLERAPQTKKSHKESFCCRAQASGSLD